MPRLSDIVIVVAAYLLLCASASAQTTQPVDRVFVLKASGEYQEFQPKDASFVPVNLPMFGLAFDRTGNGKYTGEWVPVVARPATQPATLPTTKPADIGSQPPLVVIPPVVVPPPVVVKPPGIHVSSDQSITAALKAAGSGTVVYLPTDSLFSENITADKLKSITLASYGTGKRPMVKVPSGKALSLLMSTDILVQGIDFTCDRPTAQGVQLLGCERIEFRDCSMNGFVMGLTSEAYLSKTFGFKRGKDLKLTNCVVRDNYNPAKNKDGTWGDSTGVYINETDGIVITGCTIDGNGWREGIAPGTDRNHGAYITGNNTGFVFTDNIVTNNSSFGLQARSGGIIERNLFLSNPTHLSFGYVSGAGPLFKDANGVYGVSGRVADNQFVGERKMAGQHRGVAIVFGNCKPGAVECVNNIFANDNPPNPDRGVIQAAIKTDIGILTPAGKHPDRGQDVRVKDITIQGNKGTWPVAMFKSNTGGVSTLRIQQVFEPVDVPAVIAAARARAK